LIEASHTASAFPPTKPNQGQHTVIKSAVENKHTELWCQIWPTVNSGTSPLIFLPSLSTSWQTFANFIWFSRIWQKLS